ncbi:hypothetical protein [Caldimonas brevitalea]|uniref:Integral membrane protein n=1 Tax=Caldimonas brevitalea TaxID=413882 RepID=A0A0G3BMJ5_9BURK|nr:hypothetical protein [Caldimonas brevitalea]AKJ28586.1 hypothetical protein AAW51_1895 [Caldimonas brevitalea]
MTSIQPAPLLKFALISDAVVTGAVAALQLLLPQSLADWLALPQALLVGTGVFLCGYTGLLSMLATRPSVWKSIILLLVVGNLGWAVGCIALLLGTHVSPSPLGVAFVLVQAFTVVVFAGLEYAGLKASLPAQSLRPAPL